MIRPFEVEQRLREIAKDLPEKSQELKDCVEALEKDRDVQFENKFAGVHVRLDYPIGDSKEESFYYLVAEVADLLHKQVDNLSTERDSGSPVLDDVRENSIEGLAEMLDELRDRARYDRALFDEDAIPENFTIVEAIIENS